jgi:hypothetical protein
LARLPQGKGWVSQEMVVKRWKVYKRLLFPCGVFTSANPIKNYNIDKTNINITLNF